MKVFVDRDYTNVLVTNTLLLPTKNKDPNQNIGSIYYSTNSNNVKIRTNTSWKGFSVKK